MVDLRPIVGRKSTIAGNLRRTWDLRRAGALDLAERVPGERGVGQGLDLLDLAVAEAPHVDPWKLHFLTGVLALRLAVAQHDDGVAGFDELVRGDAEGLPVVPELR